MDGWTDGWMDGWILLLDHPHGTVYLHHCAIHAALRTVYPAVNDLSVMKNHIHRFYENIRH